MKPADLQKMTKRLQHEKNRNKKEWDYVPDKMNVPQASKSSADPAPGNEASEFVRRASDVPKTLVSRSEEQSKAKLSTGPENIKPKAVDEVVDTESRSSLAVPEVQEDKSGNICESQDNLQKSDRPREQWEFSQENRAADATREQVATSLEQEHALSLETHSQSPDQKRITMK